MSQRVASLEAVISANVTGFQQAASQVKSGLASIADAAKNTKAPLGDYSNAANEITSLNKGFANSNDYVKRTLDASTSAFARSLSAGKQWNSVMLDGAKAAGLSTSQMFNMAEASKLWTNSQLASATASEMLTKRSYQLADAVKTGKMSAQEAGVAWRGYVKEQESVIARSMSFGDKMGAFSEKLNNGAKGLLQFSAAAVGIGVATKELYDFSRAGASLQYTQYQFDRLTKSIGTTSDVLLDDLRVATRGTQSDAKLTASAVDFMRLGMANTSDEVLRLAKVSSALNMDMGELTLTLANKSTRRFDQLGVSLDGFKDRLEGLKATGMDVDAAFKEAFLQQAEAQIKRVGNVADSSLGKYLQFEAQSQNLANQTKTLWANVSGETISKVGATLQAINMLASGKYKWENARWETSAESPTGQIAFDVVKYKDSLAAARDAYKKYIASGGAGSGQVTGMGGFDQADYDRRAKQYYSRQQAGQMTGRGYQSDYSKKYTPPTAAAAPQLDYAKILPMGLEYTGTLKKYNEGIDDIKENFKDSRYVTDLYKESVADLHDELARGEITQAEYTQGAKKLQQSYKDGSFAAREQGIQLADLDKQLDENSNVWAMNALAASGASEQQQYDFARASGMISQDSYEAATGVDKLTQAYKNGEISANTYAQGVAELGGWVRGLSGESFNVYVDVWIRQHGSIPTGGGGGSAPKDVKPTSGSSQPPSYATPTNWAGSTGGSTGSSSIKKYKGGPLASSGITLVGDAPGGGMTPYTEAIINGYVVDAKTTRKMYEAGLLEGAYALGTGGALGALTGSVSSASSKVVSGANKINKATGLIKKSTTKSWGASSQEQDQGNGQEQAQSEQPTINNMGAIMQISAQTQQAVSQNFARSTEQQVQSNRRGTEDIVAGLTRIETRLSKQATKDDLYAIFKGANQMSI